MMDPDLFTPIAQAAPPMCGADTLPAWHRPKGGTCSYRARYRTQDGQLVCRIHARRWHDRWLLSNGEPQ